MDKLDYQAQNECSNADSPLSKSGFDDLGSPRSLKAPPFCLVENYNPGDQEASDSEKSEIVVLAEKMAERQAVANQSETACGLEVDWASVPHDEITSLLDDSTFLDLLSENPEDTSAIFSMDSGGDSGEIVQRTRFPGQTQWGAIHFNSGAGTCMWIEQLRLQGLGSGGKPTVKPFWWQSIQSPQLKDYMRRNLVQAHLLNHNLGGPGNDMRNLAPATKFLNSQHFHQVEKPIKRAVLNEGRMVDYWIDVNYGNGPKIEDYVGSQTYFQLDGTERDEGQLLASHLPREFICNYRIGTFSGQMTYWTEWERIPIYQIK